ncbi:AbrB/MazE/SpoVT family DNA-binding domain-containing protein [Halovivax sp.]|uniref:AbrB/MazE/SpoVT family DNA-binding domain-containing protein n=1 Tax=Halovivax sp. TaxID=1935978 RepID=UPI0025C55182|nr:AbrB/MazE/SpoVT family DNA-binding domain-containing protein [Halovivax sp.]
MGSEPPADETTVSERGAVTVPADIREAFDIRPGDKIRWTIDDEGTIRAEVVKRRFGAFDDFEPVDIGETNAADEHNLYGAR